MIYKNIEIWGADCRNYGFAGCCLVEKAAADYFASIDDWDFMVLERKIYSILCALILKNIKKLS